MRLLATVYFSATSLFATAAPFVVSDPLVVRATQCGVYVDTASMVTSPVVAAMGGNICAYDLAGIAPGAHVVTMTAIAVNDPIWGSQQSVKSSPLAFTVPGTSAATAVEYFYSGFGHYFVTSLADEIAALDAGVFPGWVRTGQTFNVYPAGTAGEVNVCRFFSASFAPKSSHFYTPVASECAFVKQNPNWQFEGEVFSVLLPGSAGDCPTGTQPLYRLYNNGQGGAPNHRYTTSLATRADMLGQGWLAEGSGPIGVIACVPL